MYELESRPDRLEISLPNKSGKASFSSDIQGNILKIELKVNFDKSIYSPSYYESLKKFMGRLVDIQNNSIITLKKKN